MNKFFINSIKNLLTKIPQSWVDLTTHRLDIYNETQAKSEFLVELKKLLEKDDYSSTELEQLPTAYDYIRLGHQLSSLLEWVIAEINEVPVEQVISFSSKTMPILALLRKNALTGEQTRIYYNTESSPLIDEVRLKQIYGYSYTLSKIKDVSEVPQGSDGTAIFVTENSFKTKFNDSSNCDVTVNIHPQFGSVMLIHNTTIDKTVSDVQHVRRRETIAMTPPNALNLLNQMIDGELHQLNGNFQQDTLLINKCIQENTGSSLTPLIASSGLSIQYAILMGFIENALTHYPNKPIKILLPPNCYGGTNDQSRRIADLMPNVGIVDLLVDGGQDLVSSLQTALEFVAENDGVPLVLAEIPTNPRVEVPEMQKLGEVLSKKRYTLNNELAVEPFFMVDQTFCPNVRLLNEQSELSTVKTISFSSASKFPSGGRCIGGYCAANQVAGDLLTLIAKHLALSDNTVNSHQLHTLAENMPSMPDRIEQAYKKTREFVNFIHQLLPHSKIFYITDEIAQLGFMPSVFSLDLPVTEETKHKRHEQQKILNKKLIEFIIKAHPNTAKNCVSYGQLKGSYWTIPATSTQGTTKEDDKDYVVRVALSSDVDVTALSESFKQFCVDEGLIQLKSSKCHEYKSRS